MAALFTSGEERHPQTLTAFLNRWTKVFFRDILSGLSSVPRLKINAIPPPSGRSVECDVPVTLDKLPIDLVLCIADYLEIADMASLWLCNHNLHHKLDSRYWAHAMAFSPRHDNIPGARQELLMRFARDNGCFYYCFPLQALRRTEALGPPIWMFAGLPEGLGDNLDASPNDLFMMHNDRNQYVLSFEHVQAVMARHHHGPGHGHALRILHGKEINDPCGAWDVTTLLSVDAEIINSELVLRIQQWFLCASGQLQQVPKRRSLAICRHLNHQVDTKKRPGSLISCKLRHEQSEGCEICSYHLRCTECSAEFLIQLRNLGQDGRAVLITKWASFGAGMNWMDQRWTDNCRALGRFWAARVIAPATIAPATEPTALHRQFERQTIKKLAQLSDENANLLRGRAYRSSLICVAAAYSDPTYRLGDIWIQSPRREPGAHGRIHWNWYLHGTVYRDQPPIRGPDRDRWVAWCHLRA